MPASQQKSITVANFFGALGYISCLLQWLWATVLLLPLLLESDVKYFLLPHVDSSTTTTSTIQLSGPSLLWTIIGGIVTIIVFIITIVILVRLPQAIAKTGKKVTHTAAKTLVPIVAHTHELPAKKRLQLTARLLKIIKLTLCLMPFGLLLVSYFYPPKGLSIELIWVLGAMLAVGTMVWFSLQYAIAAARNVPNEKLI